MLSICEKTKVCEFLSQQTTTDLRLDHTLFIILPIIISLFSYPYKKHKLYKQYVI